MMYDPQTQEPIRDANGDIIRFKTGDESFVKGEDLNPTAEAIIKFLKDEYGIEPKTSMALPGE